MGPETVADSLWERLLAVWDRLDAAARRKVVGLAERSAGH
jgi:hypothetical protein